jgi:polar amino acid transport system substrate-binding protein
VPEEDKGRYHTLSGMVMWLLGRLPGHRRHRHLGELAAGGDRPRRQAHRQGAGDIDLARRCARQLGLELTLLEFDAPGQAAAAIGSGEADIGFLAIDPLRARTIHFTAPYVQIEGAYLVRDDSPLTHADEVDRPGVRVVAGRASAYHLHLSRSLAQATLVEVDISADVVGTLPEYGPHGVAAGVRQMLEAAAARVPGVRLLPGRFMVIEQAMAMPRERGAAAEAWLEDFLAAHRREGFVAEALRRHGIEGATALG